MWVSECVRACVCACVRACECVRCLRLRTRPHGYVIKSLRFHFTENGMKVLRPHDRFQIVLPVHTETMKTTENAFNLLLCMSRKLSCFQWRPSLIFSNESALGLISHDQSFPKVCVFSEPVHTKPILLYFQVFPLWRVFSKVCVFIVFVWFGVVLRCAALRCIVMFSRCY